MFLHADAHFGIHENLASIIDGPGKVEEDFRSEWVVGINQVTQVTHPPAIVPHRTKILLRNGDGTQNP